METSRNQGSSSGDLGTSDKLPCRSHNSKENLPHRRRPQCRTDALFVMGVAGIHRFRGNKLVNETPRVPLHYLVGDADVGRTHTSGRRGTVRWLYSYLSTALRIPEAARPWLGMNFPLHCLRVYCLRLAAQRSPRTAAIPKPTAANHVPTT